MSEAAGVARWRKARSNYEDEAKVQAMARWRQVEAATSDVTDLRPRIHEAKKAAAAAAEALNEAKIKESALMAAAAAAWVAVDPNAAEEEKNKVNAAKVKAKELEITADAATVTAAELAVTTETAKETARQAELAVGIQEIAAKKAEEKKNKAEKDVENKLHEHRQEALDATVVADELEETANTADETTRQAWLVV